jgi:transcriptional regulator with XRE-family HTH domain
LEWFGYVRQTYGMPKQAPNEDRVHYWKHTIARYVRKKRIEAETHQKQVPVARRTISDIENGKSNFRLETLLEVLEAIGGDVSEAFKSRVPKDLHGDARPWHEMLQLIFESGDQDEIRLVQRVLRDAYASAGRIRQNTSR